MEEFRDIPNFEGLYKINRQGKIWSYKSNKFLSDKVNTIGLFDAQNIRHGKTRNSWIRLAFPKKITEEVKDIPIFNGKYSISKTGNIYSNVTKNKLTPTSTTRSPYLYVKLSYNGKKTHFSVHRLVALTYIPNPNNLKEVDHINRNILDNRVENLRWVSRTINLINSSLGFRRNTRQCSLYVNGQFIKCFSSVKECCDYARDVYGASWCSLQKHRKIKEFEIKCND